MNEMKNKKHHTMETIPKWPQKNTTLWEQFQNEKNPQYGNNSKMKKQKIPHSTLWKQFQNLIVSSGAGTAYLSGASEFTPSF